MAFVNKKWKGKGGHAPVDPGKRQMAIARYGFRALSWSLTNKDILQDCTELERDIAAFGAALQVGHI